METVSTRSIETAAFLVARGHRVVRTTRTGKDVHFHFPDTPQLLKDSDALNYGDDNVSARAFSAARSRLLDLIFDRSLER